MSCKPGGVRRVSREGTNAGPRHPAQASWGVGRRHRLAPPRRPRAVSCPLRQTTAVRYHVGPNLQPLPPGIVERSTGRVPPAAAIAIRTAHPSGITFSRTASGGTVHGSVRLASAHRVSLSGSHPPGWLPRLAFRLERPGCGKVYEAGYNIVPGANQQRDSVCCSRIGCSMTCNFTVSCRVLKCCTWSVGEYGKSPIGHMESTKVFGCGGGLADAAMRSTGRGK
jgi:hypothetical protein